MTSIPGSVKSGVLNHKGRTTAAGGRRIGVAYEKAGTGKPLFVVDRRADQVLVGEFVDHQRRIPEFDDGIVLADRVGKVEAVLKAGTAATCHVDTQLEFRLALFLDKCQQPVS